QPAPQFRLPDPLPRQRAAGPVDVVFGGPGLEHARPVDAVAVVEVGQVAGAGEAPNAPSEVEVRWGGIGPAAAGAQVAGQRGEPGFAEGGVDHVEEGPDGTGGDPGIGVA